MDRDRQIRFLISPFFFFLSLAWSAHVAGKDFIDFADAHRTISNALAAGAATIPIGFAISTVSIAVLRLALLMGGNKTYEAFSRNPAAIWARLSMREGN